MFGLNLIRMAIAQNPPKLNSCGGFIEEWDTVTDAAGRWGVESDLGGLLLTDYMSYSLNSLHKGII